MTPTFEDVGGAAYMAAAILQLSAATPDSLVIDAGDISEGNPVGDVNGNQAMTGFYSRLSSKLAASAGAAWTPWWWATTTCATRPTSPT
jgi:hypothetical protein